MTSLAQAPYSNDMLASHLLYPFGNAVHAAKHPPLVIEGGDGVYVTDGAGKRYIDGQAGLWSVNVGHGRPEIKRAIAEQLEGLSYHSLFGAATATPSVSLAATLCRLTAPDGMVRTFFSSGGSEAMEAAFKLAWQYWRHCGEPMRHKVISLRRGYHGVTLGALSANGAASYREYLEPLMPGFIQVETPHVYRNPFTTDPEALGRLCAGLLEREIIHQNPKTVAAFVAEPVQGTGGVIVPPANFWPLLRQVCDRHGVLMISDEVATGFGRLGSMFGCRHWGVKPDIMVLAKGMHSDYVPLGATMMNERVAEVFLAGDTAEPALAAFGHGNTYSGHPLACAAALANLEIIEEEELDRNAREVGAYVLERLRDLQTRHRIVGDVRGLGLMLGVELVADPKTKQAFDFKLRVGARVAELCRENGVLIRNLADTVVISPPLVLTKAHADEIVNTLEVAVGTVGRA